MSAQKHIDEALRLKARLEGLVGQLHRCCIASQDFLNKAKAADARGDLKRKAIFKASKENIRKGAGCR